MGKSRSVRKKRTHNLKIQRYNPSKRKNETISLEEVQVGVLKYRDIADDFECLVGIETESIKGDMYTKHHSTIKKQPRRITRIKWDVSWGDHKVGDRVCLSPRDIAILDAVLTYLKKMGFYIP